MRRLFAALACAVALCAWGQADEVAKPDAKVEARLKEVAEELRCLVCQNQTIADSEAPLAVDLRNEMRAQIAQGWTDEQIRRYMVERYGDFVLYRPPLKATTVLLWIGPFALLLVGAAILVFIARSRRRAAAGVPQPSPERTREIAAMLEAAPDRDLPRGQDAS
jgi:cytochrome c-type biogenesis protein CcmH